MSIKQKRRIKYTALFLAPVLLIAMVALTSAMSKSADAADAAPCAACHDDTTLIAGKATAWAESGHGTGTAFARGTSASCAGCHSGGGFSARILAGLGPDEVTAGDPDPTRQDCRACHQIHTTYEGTDWALETTDPVSLYALGTTFDGGEGNLCAQCHQPRRQLTPNGDGTTSVTSSHWGPHHGPQSAMMLGVGGATASPGSPGGHYSYIGNTCVDCHMGAGADHSYEPDVDRCQGCHSGATDFDMNGRQTSTQADLDAIGAELVSLGLLSANDTVDGHPVPGTYPDGQAAALWNWIMIAREDGSLGVHNPAYTQAMLDEAAAGLGITLPSATP